MLKLYFHLRYVLSWPAHYRTGRHGHRLALFYFQSHAHIHVQFVLDTIYDSAKGPICSELILVSVAWSDVIDEVFLLNPGWDASLLQGYPQH